LLPGRDAFLLENHGALTLGRSARQAALRMDLLEQNARISLMVRQLGKPFALAPADQATLMTFRAHGGMGMRALRNTRFPPRVAL
jgi:L-fuculose-phosphate aldolase